MIDKLKELEKNASPGPWIQGDSFVSNKPGVGPGYPPKDGCIASLHDGEYIENLNAKNDAELIALMRNALPKLLALYDAAKAVEHADNDLKLALKALEEV